MNRMNVKFALVTGSADFIDNHLVDRLVSNGRSVRVFRQFQQQKNGKY